MFEGDLNIVQYYALSYSMGSDKKELVELEQERMKYTILANNPSLYKSIYEDKSIEDDIPGDVEWITPTSIEETENLVRMLEGR